VLNFTGSPIHPPLGALTLLIVPPYGASSLPGYDMPPYGVPPMTSALPHLAPLGTPTMTLWSPLAGGSDLASLAAAYSTMVLAPLSPD
jgi:hypothetical protein